MAAGLPTQDLSVSPTTFDWGIPCPDADGHVMYVWFDALSNYLSGIGFDASKTLEENQQGTAAFWPCDCHLIGKDISWFHCVIWPCLLMSVGVPLPKTVLAHGFVHGADGRKMSKSLGNVVDPHDALSRFSTDTFRFFLVRESPVGADLNFSETAIALRHNSELADTYGNLVHRALSLCDKYADGCVPDAQAEAVIDVGALIDQTDAAMRAYAVDLATNHAIEALFAGNKYVTDSSPWHLKPDDPRRQVIVRTLLEIIYVVSHFLQPTLTVATATVFIKLATPPLPIGHLRRSLSNLAPATKVTVGDVLFAKVETAEALEKQQADAAAKKKAAEAAAKKAAAARAQAEGGGASVASPLARCLFLVGTVTAVEMHPEADSLYVETIDLGEPTPRQVVSGLVKHLPLEQLLHARVVCLANAKPNKLRGVESQAMVLCATSADGSKVELLQPPRDAPPGERVTFAGHEGEPDDVLNPKKKVWEKEVQPKLHTTAERVACFDGIPFTTTHGPCTAPTAANGTIK